MARSVCWRGSASRPPFSRSRRCESRSSSCSGESTPCGRRRARRERQVVEARAELATISLGVGSSAARARRKSATASRRRAAAPGTRARPGSAGSSRLVTSSVEFGQRRRAPPARARRRSAARGCRAAAASLASATCSARPSLAPSACATVASTSAGSRSDASGDPEDARRVTLGRARRPPGARAASCPSHRAGQREQASLVASSSATTSASSRSRPTKGVAGAGRFVFESDFERREVAVSELVDRIGCVEVLEPVFAEVRSSSSTSVGGRCENEHLAAVAGGGDPCGTVDVVADVTLLGERAAFPCGGRCEPGRPAGERLASAPPRPRAHPAPSGRRRRRRRPACRPRPRRARACLADHAPVLGQRLGIRLRAELVQQLRRALDVGEQEGDGAGRQVGYASA